MEMICFTFNLSLLSLQFSDIAPDLVPVKSAFIKNDIK